MATALELQLSSEPIFQARQSDPMFLLHLQFQHKFRSSLRNLDGRVRTIQSSPTSQTSFPPLRLEPHILADPSTCGHYICRLLFSTDLGLVLSVSLAPRIASFLILTSTRNQLPFSGFCAYVTVEFVHEQFLDAQEIVMMLTMVDAVDVAEPRRGAGVSRSVLMKLKEERFSAAESSGGDGSRTISTTECAICLEEFCEGVKLIKMPNCDHTFHQKCIYRWLEDHNSCPMCRRQVEN